LHFLLYYWNFLNGFSFPFAPSFLISIYTVVRDTKRQLSFVLISLSIRKKPDFGFSFMFALIP
jgi:hypothetical protein